MIAPVPPVHFANAAGTRLAYQDFGSGDEIVVAVPPMAQNIEVAWERAEPRAMFDRFASFCRYIHFDKRGTGSSDRNVAVAGIDERVDDLRAVMDAAGVERAHLFAQSEGGPMTLLFAATYPDRVQSVILNGSGARLATDEMVGARREEEIAIRRRVAELWGTPQSPIVDLFAPSLAGDASFREWHQRYERTAAGADSLLDLLVLMLDMDAREVLPRLEVPVLVLHRTGDQRVPIEFGREVAEAVPGARLVEVDGNDHFGYAGDVDAWMDEFERWVTGTVRPRAATPPARGDVCITTFGGFDVAIGGQPVDPSSWGSKLARRLCKRLLVARGWPVTRDELIDLLWPGETDTRRLGARLSVQLSTVRRVLGGGVAATRETVRLDLDEVTTDVEEFFAASPGAAVELYRGEFLPEDRYDDYAAELREAARARFVSHCRELATAALDDDPATAAGYARRAVSADKWDDEANRLLVVALLRGGERSRAHAAHADWAVAGAELGVETPPLSALE